MVFGSYPEVITAKDRQQKMDILHELVESYLFKDLLSLDRIKNSRVLVNLVKLLALQIGNEVSLNEIATQLGIDFKTVARYLSDLLEKSFIIINLGAFSRNLRNEITKKHKYYFPDNGIKNAMINQFNSLSDRNDVGQVWENFILMERLKKREYQRIYANTFFWRTYLRQEIDLIEERRKTIWI